jgi:ribosome maturation factor RimP
MKIDQAVQNQLAALAADEGLELLAAEVVGSGPKTILRLVVDGPDGASLEKCASVSRQASAILDVEEPIDHQYTLEVSSPGLDRKLYKPGDFERFAGSRVKIRMKPTYREHRAVVGELVGMTDAGLVRLVVENGHEVNLPYDEVFEARLEVDWNSIMKEGKTRS